MKSLKVAKKNAESARKKLISFNYFDFNRKTGVSGNFVYFPLKDGFSKSKLMGLGAISAKKLSTLKSKPKSMSELLSKKLSKKELDILKTSFDIFGDVIIVEIPLQLVKKEKEIGGALLKLYPRVRAIFKKSGAVSGVTRARPMKKIAGTGSAEATYKEHGCTLKFDISKVFFTPRLSTERGIVAGKVKAGETVLCMFAGCGPFAILIAKKQPNIKEVHAVDINPDAFRYLQENIRINKVSEKVKPYCGDAKKLISSKFTGIADRVIMNLPKTSVNFLSDALKALKPEGGVIHYYTFKATKEEVQKEIKQRLAGKKHKILAIRNVKPYAPREYCFAADIKIYK
ncbi:MAG: class I SAM-dependent methyltransferase family protein [archaeon]